MKTFTKTIIYSGEKNCTLTATAKLHKIGNQKPYFSVTGEISKGRREIACGCLHEEISKHFGSKLDSIIALHLSDEDGVPMHAEENAVYRAGFTKWDGSKNLKFLASSLRISDEQAETLAAGTEAELRAFVKAQMPRWKLEAEAGRAFLNT